jgi:hypothetical protein
MVGAGCSGRWYFAGLELKTMVFIPQQKRFRLKFADEEYEGLEVTMRSISIGQLLHIQTMQTTKDADGAIPAAATEELLKTFSQSLVEWNLASQDGEVLEANLENVMDQEIALIMAVIAAWTEAVSGVAAPLDETSTSGGTSLLASIPKETLSPSLAS